VNNHDLTFLLPLIFCIDERGTDGFQRCPLEPLMFTFALICRHMRENAGAWRHAGFIPKVKDFGTSLEGLQMCHDCLSAILADWRSFRQTPQLLSSIFWWHEERSQDNFGSHLCDGGPKKPGHPLWPQNVQLWRNRPHPQLMHVLFHACF
jgi:hypothetical protein